jgi:histidine triad (HIT) family protein
MIDCVFCRIIAGQLEASWVYEDHLTLAFMSMEQPNPYKVLVITRDHVESVFDLNEAQAAAVMRTTVKVANAIRETSHCEGLNLVQSNGRVGQQDVFHFHLHLVPRSANDGIVLDWDNATSERAVLDTLAAELRGALQA